MACAFARSTTITIATALAARCSPHRAAAFAAGQLYTTLSVAMLQPQRLHRRRRTQDVRQRYEQASPTRPCGHRASSGLTDEPLWLLLGRVNAQLAVTPGLVEPPATTGRNPSARRTFRGVGADADQILRRPAAVTRRPRAGGRETTARPDPAP